MNRKIKENDLFIYFEAIEQLEPQTVLDIGMLLRRAGIVSRKAMNREIPEEIKLDGVSFTPQASFPALKNVYDKIMNIQTFLRQASDPKYDCTILIGIETLKMHAPLSDLLQKARQCSKYILTDHLMEEQPDLNYKFTDLKVDEDLYYLYNFGE